MNNKTGKILFFLFLFFSYCSYSSVIINEIQPAPVGEEPEWIELFNPASDTLFIKNAQITDNASTKDLPEMIIPPQSFALISKDTLALQQSRDIPQKTVFYQSKLPGFNNTYDMAVISDSTDITLDSLYYDLDWGEKGISFERIDHEKPANKDNISPCKDESGATPGRPNSVIPAEYDLELVTISFNNGLSLLIRNIGKRDAEDAKLKIMTENVVKIKRDIDHLPSGDSAVMEFDESELKENLGENGYVDLMSLIDLAEDEDPLNDSAYTRIYLSYPAGSLKINEILFQPDDDNSEFIELKNISRDSINILGWKIFDQDKKSGPDVIEIEEDILIPPGQLSLVAMDSSIFISFPELMDNELAYITEDKFNLNNDTDEIIIREPNGNTQDTLRYYEDWHSEWVRFPENISLERKDLKKDPNLKSNWASCTDMSGSTPLAENSVNQPKPDRMNIIATPNPFSRLSGEGKVKIEIELPFEQALIRAYIYTPDGMRVRKIADDIMVPSFTEIFWDGSNEKGYDLQIGPYILIVEAADMSSDEILTKKKMLVIGE